MKTSDNNSVKLTLLIFLISFVTVVNAQKLPNVQRGGLRAPLNIKVDGTPVEWGGNLQAYNYATDIFYTMANDNDNLYLIVQSKNPDIISRIIGGGVTLSIQQGKLKNDKNKVSITYPVTEKMPYFHLRKGKNEIEDTTAKAADSLMKRNNNILDNSCKFIQVIGIQGIDTLISVYNENGIKARGQFDNKRTYTCEVSIKLKLLNISLNGISKFTYRVCLNGAKPVIAMVSFVEPGGEELMTNVNANSTPTYFWGEYTLAKK